MYKANVELFNARNGKLESTDVAVKIRNKKQCCLPDGKCHSIVDDLKEASFLGQFVEILVDLFVYFFEIYRTLPTCSKMYL